MKLSVVIPAHNEEGSIERTVRILHGHLNAERIDHEILVVNDNSSDETEAILTRLQEEIPNVSFVSNTPPNGFGFAVRTGLEQYTGDAVAVYMADGSDRPEDLVQFFETLESKQVDCVFGSRFVRGAKVVGYPFLKLGLNRLANLFIRTVFALRYNDVTNAFKLYRRHVIDGLKPFLSHHFNLTVELPLKAIVRGYSYEVVPNDWINRKAGVSNLKVQEMGSRYLFIVLYCLIEKWFSKGDYLKQRAAIEAEAAPEEVTAVPKPRWLQVMTYVLGVLAILYFTLAILPAFGTPIGTGLDGSCLYGLNYLAQSEHLFGRDVAFTYGPLVYLLVPLNIGNNLLRAVWFGLSIYGLMSAVLLYQLIVKKWLWPIVLFVAIYLFAHHLLLRSYWGREYVFLTAFCLLLYISLERNTIGLVAGFLCGVLASVFLFMKFSLGLSAATMLLLCNVFLAMSKAPGVRRTVSITGGAYLATTVALTLVLFGSPAYLFSWLKMSFAIADGYSIGSSMTGPTAPLYAGVAALFLYFLLALVLFVYRRRSRVRFLPVVYAAGVFFAFKHGFVRQDAAHPMFFFTFIIAVMGITVLSAIDKKELALSVAAGVVVMLLAYPATNQFAPNTYSTLSDTYLATEGLTNVGRLRNFNQVRRFLNGMSSANLAASRLPNGWAELIRKHNSTMDVLPWEISFSVANGIVWAPSPLLQTYLAALSGSLDERNADHFRGAQSPDYLVVQFTNLDYRNLLLDVPDTWRAILANYELVERDLQGMLLLKKRAQPSELYLTDVAAGRGMIDQWIDVPSTDNLLFASFDLRLRLPGKVVKTVFRISPVHLDVVYSSGRVGSYRITPDVARNGLLINFLPENTEDVGKLFAHTFRDRVVRMKVSGPGAAYLKRVFDFTWKQEPNYKMDFAQPFL